MNECWIVRHVTYVLLRLSRQELFVSIDAFRREDSSSYRLFFARCWVTCEKLQGKRERQQKMNTCLAIIVFPYKSYDKFKLFFLYKMQKQTTTTLEKMSNISSSNFGLTVAKRSSDFFRSRSSQSRPQKYKWKNNQQQFAHI